MTTPGRGRRAAAAPTSTPPLASCANFSFISARARRSSVCNRNATSSHHCRQQRCHRMGLVSSVAMVFPQGCRRAVRAGVVGVALRAIPSTALQEAGEGKAGRDGRAEEDRRLSARHIAGCGHQAVHLAVADLVRHVADLAGGIGDQPGKLCGDWPSSSEPAASTARAKPRIASAPRLICSSAVWPSSWPTSLAHRSRLFLYRLRDSRRRVLDALVERSGAVAERSGSAIHRIVWCHVSGLVILNRRGRRPVETSIGCACR